MMKMNGADFAIHSRCDMKISEITGEFRFNGETRPAESAGPTRRLSLWSALVLFPLLALWSATLFGGEAGETNPTEAAEKICPFTSEELRRLDSQAALADEIIWSRFYSPETDLFYDYITSYDENRAGLATLPTAEEVKAQRPNVCGYGTGMEDGLISGGVLLTMIVDRAAVTGEDSLRGKAEAIFRGIERCSMIPGAPGFMARGISPLAPDAVYINSSRDQVTHAVSSLWEYYRSPLPSEEIKGRIRSILTAVADRMIRNVTPENDYDFLCADGSRCRRGICKMDQVDPHEAARLTMIYAAAADVCGDSPDSVEKDKGEEYRRRWRSHIDRAIEESKNPLPHTTTYGLLQMGVSLELLWRLEPDEAHRERIREVMIPCGRMAASRGAKTAKKAENLDWTAVAPDWRTVGGLVDPYRTVWYSVRESGEIPLTLLLTPGEPFPAEQQKYLADAINRVDFHRVSTCGVYDLLAAWWKAKRRGYYRSAP